MIDADIQLYREMAEYEALRVRLADIADKPAARVRFEAAVAVVNALRAYGALFGRDAK